MILPILRALPNDGIVIVYNGDNSRSTIPVLCLRKTLSKTSCISLGLQPRVRVRVNPDDLLCDLSSAIILLMYERKRMVVVAALLWLWNIDDYVMCAINKVRSEEGVSEVT